MSKNDWVRVTVGLAMAVVLTLGLLTALRSAPIAEPVAPRAVGVDRPPVWVVVNSAQVTQSTSFAGQSWGAQGYSLADVYWSVDQAAADSYLTLTLQVSPDNSNWYTYAAATDVLANSSGDTSGYTATLPVHLQFFRVTATVSNTVEGTAVTPTVRVLLH